MNGAVNPVKLTPGPDAEGGLIARIAGSRKVQPTQCSEPLHLPELCSALLSRKPLGGFLASLAKSNEAAFAVSPEMATTLREVLWQQFGAAIEMLESALRACPDELWGDRSQRPEFWYVAYHTLFFLDLYLSDSVEGFAPPAPFILAELDPAGVLPERPYTKDELQTYLEHGRKKCRAAMRALTDETSREIRRILSFDGSLLELLLYNMRHVQHHAAQLNLILRQRTDSAPGYVAKAEPLGDL